MNTAFIGFNTKDVTLTSSGTISVGQPVVINSNNTVAKASADAKFCGFASAVNGKNVSVTVAGYVKVRYTGTAPTHGYCNLSSNGTTGVKIDDTNGRLLLVVGVDTVNKTVEIIL